MTMAGGGSWSSGVCTTEELRDEEDAALSTAAGARRRLVWEWL